MSSGRRESQKEYEVDAGAGVWIRSRRVPAVVSERLGTLVRNLTTDRRNRCARSCKLPQVRPSSPPDLVSVSTQQTQWQRALSDSPCVGLSSYSGVKKPTVLFRDDNVMLCHGIRPEYVVTVRGAARVSGGTGIFQRRPDQACSSALDAALGRRQGEHQCAAAALEGKAHGSGGNCRR